MARKTAKKEGSNAEKEISGWKREIARDFIALGGIPFFVLVLVRVYILSQPHYFYQFLVAGGLFMAVFFLVKQNIYSGLALIALFFTANHYQDMRYSIFGGLVYLGLLFSLNYLGSDRKKIILGMVLGAITIFISLALIS